MGLDSSPVAAPMFQWAAALVIVALLSYLCREMKAARSKPSSTSYRRKASFPRRKRPAKTPIEADKKLLVHREAQKLLDKIGSPEPAPFVPDPFQLESIRKLDQQDVLVVAPTGSGKTWIALQASSQYLSRGLRVWYATPLKALSNAKYEEFGQALGTDNIGILTGDRKENPDAPIIVGTTEILRNQLYDEMELGRDLPLDLVIIDEAHYLGDWDRGVVWEEVLIYSPGRVRLLLLSATISNAEELAAWLTHIRKTPCAVVQSDDRPVPLHALFRSPTGEVVPLLQGRRFFPKMARFAKTEKRGRPSADSRPIDMNSIVGDLRECGLLPAIVFLKSRSDCDKALRTLLPAPAEPSEGGFEDAVREYVKPYPELKNEERVEKLLTSRAGSHHAGQLPGWRLLIERMMSQGHLDVIFSTSTVAAGVNFPARTVVLVQSDRFNGREFVDMSSTEIHQMTGRAGRRGMDKVGFIFLVPGRHMDIALVKTLLLSSPEPLQSRIAVNFSMTMNLLLSHDPNGVRELLGYSFAAFHPNPRLAARVNRRLLGEFQKHLSVLQELEYVDENGVPTHDGKWAARLRLDHPLVIAELIRQGEFDHLDYRELAALIAPFVMDKDKEYQVSMELWEKTRQLWKRMRRMAKRLRPLMQFLVLRGFDVPAIMFWPAAAVFLWAEGVEWTELVDHVTADEGDLSMLILRTADHLRQFLSLEGEQPELAGTAREALQHLMRRPLI